jgi:transporter family-2 protein
MALVFLLLGFGAGAAFPIQAGLNARLATWVGGPIRASLVSFSVGTAVMLVLALATTRGLVDTSRIDATVLTT